MTNIGRHELKHFINQADYMELKLRLRHVVRPDINGSAYRVRSLYFDNYSDKALHEKTDGLEEREKFRLRLYNGDTSFIRLEKKSKRKGKCFKQSAEISPYEVREILNGNYSVLKKDANPLKTELYAKMQYQSLRPKIIVDYLREAYVFSAGNVRITTDYDIRWSENTGEFLNEHIFSVPVPETIILEVKYDNFLPEIIRGIVALANRQRSAFSKYAAARVI